jgi:hypothetical protein
MRRFNAIIGYRANHNKRHYLIVTVRMRIVRWTMLILWILSSGEHRRRGFAVNPRFPRTGELLALKFYLYQLTCAAQVL